MKVCFFVFTIHIADKYQYSLKCNITSYLIEKEVSYRPVVLKFSNLITLFDVKVFKILSIFSTMIYESNVDKVL